MTCPRTTFVDDAPLASLPPVITIVSLVSGTPVASGRFPSDDFLLQDSFNHGYLNIYISHFLINLKIKKKKKYIFSLKTKHYLHGSVLNIRM